MASSRRQFGRLKAHTTLVPLSSAQAVQEGVKVSYRKDVVT
jgi:hypothetical protein